MVSVIRTGKSIRRAFHYNENKVKERAAEILVAANYPLDAQTMTASQRLQLLLHQAALNQRVTRNSVHISLNFDPADKLDNDKLIQIAEQYMKGVGFADQPYLVYRHHDAGHPHIHIVTTNVRRDGRRIDMFNIGRNASESTRKAIEREFNLVHAERQRAKATKYELKPVDPQKVVYGKAETKKAIGLVLDAVLEQYKYGSLPELNAILQGFRVLADRGDEQSLMFKKGGLVYRVLDNDGNKIGVPIKASLFHQRPTLAWIAARFAQNKKARVPFQEDLRSRIDRALAHTPSDQLAHFKAQLAREGIVLVPRQNEEGRIYGLTYVDQRHKTVFNGSELGKGYTAAGLASRWKVEFKPSHEKISCRPKSRSSSVLSTDQGMQTILGLQPIQPSFLAELFQPELNTDPLPYELTAQGQKKKRRRRKRNL